MSQSERGHTYWQWLVAVLANTTTVSLGMQLGWVSPMTKVLQSESSPTGPLTDIQIPWIASTLFLSAVVGVSLYAYITDKYGRKMGVIAIAVPQAISWIVILFASNFATLLMARILSGLAGAGCFIVIPIYVKEISQDNIRGLLGSLLAMSQSVGLLTMFGMGAYLGFYTVIWTVIWLPIGTLPVLFIAPESPAFLVKIGKVEEAEKTIAFLRGLDPGDKVVQYEISRTKKEEEYIKSLPNVSFVNILKNKIWRRLFIIALCILSVNAFNGAITIMSYASAVLESTGATVSPDLQSLSIPLVMILSAFVSMACIERFGRKPLLGITLAVVTLTMTVIGSIFLVQYQGSSVPSWLPVSAIVMSVAANSAGIASVPFIVISEMFNFQIRAKVMGCILTYTWLIGFLQLMAYTPMCNALGTYTTFYVFAGVNLFGVFVSLVLLPETKGKTVEEIESEISQK